MYIDARFDNQDQWTDYVSSSRALVPVEPHGRPRILVGDPDKVDPGFLLLPPPQPDKHGFRHFTPRQMVEASMDLYVAGRLTWDEYALLAFQPELHPDFDRTVGALTGRKAEPDRPRDFIADWEDRLRFEERYNARAPHLVENTRRVVAVLKQTEDPVDILT